MYDNLILFKIFFLKQILRVFESLIWTLIPGISHKNNNKLYLIIWQSGAGRKRNEQFKHSNHNIWAQPRNSDHWFHWHKTNWICLNEVLTCEVVMMSFVSVFQEEETECGDHRQCRSRSRCCCLQSTPQLSDLVSPDDEFTTWNWFHCFRTRDIGWRLGLQSVAAMMSEF